MPGASPDLSGRDLFEPEFYLLQFSPGQAPQRDPFRDFLDSGGSAGRNPHPLFDCSYYLEQQPELRLAGANPLLHYLQSGSGESVNPHPLFDTRYYRRQVSSLPSGVNPLVHFLQQGWRSGANPHPLFDIAYYLDQRPDVRRAGVNPAVHYLIFGADEGTNPHPLFNSRYYQRQVPDPRSIGNPLVHFLRHGWHEGLDPHPLFVTRYYLAQRRPSHRGEPQPNPLVEFLQNRHCFGIDPHPLFLASAYLRDHPDVAQAGVNPLMHYVKCGASEGRRPNPWMDFTNYGPVPEGTTPLVFFLTHGIREGHAPNKLAARDGMFHRLVSRSLQDQDFALAVRQDRRLMGLERLDSVITAASGVRSIADFAASSGLPVTRLAPERQLAIPAPTVLPPHRAWSGAMGELPAQYVAQLSDVIAVGGSRLLITSCKTLLHDEMADPLNDRYGGKLRFVRAQFGANALAHVQMARIDIDTGVLVASDADGNYYHWIVEALPKLELVEAAAVPADVPLLISETVPDSGIAALKRLTARAVIRLSESTGYRVGRLYYPSDRSRVLNNYTGPVNTGRDVVIDPAAIDFLRHHLLPRQLPAPSRQLFLRRESGYRRLMNQSELQAALTRRGFETVETGTMDLEEQISLWSEARVVVAPAGAALTNLVFAQPSAEVIILTSDHPQINPNIFSQIGSHIGVKTRFCFGDRCYSLSGKYSVHDDFRVDERRILRCVDEAAVPGIELTQEVG